MGKKGFTLAEILITLGVIGVVAAMTLPTLIKNYNNYVTAQKLKKAYNTLSNGIRMAEVDYGPMKDWQKGEEIGVYNYFNTYFKPYFKEIKICDTPTKCGYKNFDNNKWQDIKFLVRTNDSRLLFKLIDNLIVFYPFSSGTIQYKIFYVDINGVQGPNEFEKDVFKFSRSTNKSIEPIGKALKIMQDGWKIK